ncbi:MAG: hypothetical protein H0X47_05840 [Nitrospirales bacterium]|nr:hypothetical protein [Nitrospirales bacterium]
MKKTRRVRHEKLKYLAKLALSVLMGVFGSFLISESALRVMNISYPVFHGFDPVRGRALEPGMEGWFR